MPILKAKSSDGCRLGLRLFSDPLNGLFTLFTDADADAAADLEARAPLLLVAGLAPAPASEELPLLSNCCDADAFWTSENASTEERPLRVAAQYMQRERRRD